MTTKDRIIVFILLGFLFGFGSYLSYAEHKIEAGQSEQVKSEQNQAQKIEELEKEKEVLTERIEGKEVNYMYGIATAYTPSMGGTNSDSDPTMTSTMKTAKEGVIAVNPDIIPYGSEVMIISGNTVIRGKAEDTGGAMKRNPEQVDILMEDHEEAIEWGRQEVIIIFW